VLIYRMVAVVLQLIRNQGFARQFHRMKMRAS